MIKKTSKQSTPKVSDSDLAQTMAWGVQEEMRSQRPTTTGAVAQRMFEDMFPAGYTPKLGIAAALTTTRR